LSEKVKDKKENWVLSLMHNDIFDYQLMVLMGQIDILGSAE
jgi:hypothetical protein